MKILFLALAPLALTSAGALAASRNSSQYVYGDSPNYRDAMNTHNRSLGIFDLDESSALRGANTLRTRAGDKRTDFQKRRDTIDREDLN